MSHLVKMASKEDSKKKKKRHKKGDGDVPTLDAEDQTPSSPRSEEKKKKKTKKSKDGKSHSKKHHKSPRATASETGESSKRKLGDEDEDDSNDSGTVGIREDLMDIGKRKLAARPVESGKSSKRGDEVYTVSIALSSHNSRLTTLSHEGEKQILQNQGYWYNFRDLKVPQLLTNSL